MKYTNQLNVFLLLALPLMFGCAAKSPSTFSAPEAATAALFDAANSGSGKDLARLFGADYSEIYSSGDKVADGKARNQFVTRYLQGHELEDAAEGSKVLVVGQERWPFPVPLVQDKKGGWSFDSEAGVEEIINRRIGKNELNAIDVCRTIARAQREYYELDIDGDGVREYAKRILSTPGQRDGLFWSRQPKERPSPIGPLIATAEAEGYVRGDQPKPFRGYYFKLLTEKHGKTLLSKEGELVEGFALIAYPAEWGNSGVMTFLISDDGKLVEKNLGEDTNYIAPKILAYAPDESWREVTTEAVQPK